MKRLVLAGLLATLACNPASAKNVPNPDPPDPWSVWRVLPDRTDCSGASGPDAAFCESPTLMAAEAAVAELAEAVRRTPMWVAFDQEHDRWKWDTRNPDAPRWALHRSYADRARRLQGILQDTQRTLARSVARQTLARECLVPPFLSFETFQMRCQPGRVENVAPGIIMQRQDWRGVAREGVADPEVRGAQSVMILQGSKGGWRPIAWGDQPDGWFWGLPKLTENARGRFLSITRHRGVLFGHASALVVRRQASGRWREVEAEAWRTQVRLRLPRGAVPSMMPTIDLVRWRTTIGLVRDSDPFRMTSEGEANIRLGLQGDTVVVTDMVIRKPHRPR